MLCKTIGHALKIFPFRETSSIVVWLTREYGKLASVLKGAHREKSVFLGQVDLFYTCEIVFYSKEQQGLHILKECYPLSCREQFRTDWKAAAAASYLASLTERVTPVGPPHENLFEWLASCWQQLCERSPGAAFIPYAELQLLQLLGFSPALDSCSACAKKLDVFSAADSGMPKNSSRIIAYFSAAQGNAVCAECAEKKTPEKSIPISEGTWRILAEMKKLRPDFSLSGAIFEQLSAITGGLVAHHLDIEEKARSIALDVLRRT